MAYHRVTLGHGWPGPQPCRMCSEALPSVHRQHVSAPTRGWAEGGVRPEQAEEGLELEGQRNGTKSHQIEPQSTKWIVTTWL